MLFKKQTAASADPTPAKRSWFKKPGKGGDTDVTDVEVHAVPAVADEADYAGDAHNAAALVPHDANEAAAPAKKARRTKGHKDDGTRPIKLLVGYLTDTTEKDTYYYMLGVAERNLDSDNIGWAGLFPFEGGFAYEIHEGGNGRSYLESVIEHFRSLPPFTADEDQYVFIHTTSRTVRIERTKTGLHAVLLPEGETPEESEFVQQGKKLTPLVEKRTGLFLSGVALLLVGLMAMAGAFITRYQPYTPGVLKMDRVPVAQLPFSQWVNVMRVPSNDYVTALRYEKGKWVVETALTGKAGLPTPGAGGKPAGAASAAAGPAAGAASAPTPPVPPLPAAPK